MPKLARVLVALSVLLGALPASARAEDYHLAPLDAVNVSAEDARAVTTLLRASLERQSQRVVEKEKDGRFSLRPRLVKLGGSLILSVDKLEGERVRFSTQLRADRIEELDRVVDRVITAVVREDAASRTGAIGKVVESEARDEAARKPAVGQRQFGFGPALVGNLGTDAVGAQVTAGFGWQVAPQVALGVGLDVATSTSPFFDATYVQGGIRAQVFASPDDHAPFVSLLAGYGMADPADDALGGADGFAAGLGVGYRFFRTSTVNLEVALGYSVIFDRNAAGAPRLFGLTAVLHY